MERADLTPDLFGAPQRTRSAFDQARELHYRKLCARSDRERRELHAAAMEIIYAQLGPKPDGRMPEVKR